MSHVYMAAKSLLRDEQWDGIRAGLLFSSRPCADPWPFVADRERFSAGLLNRTDKHPRGQGHVEILKVG